MHSSSVCKSYYESLIDYINSRGVSEAEICSLMKWNPRQQLNAEGRLPRRFFKVILDVATQQLDDPFLAVKAGLRAGRKSISLVSFLLISAPTVENAIEDISSYSGLLVSGIAVDLIRWSGGEVTFRLSEGEDSDVDGKYMIFVISAWLGIMRRVISGAELIRLSGPHLSSIEGGINACIGVSEIKDAEHYEVRVNLSNIRKRSAYPDISVHAAMREKAELAMLGLRCDNRIVESVKECIVESLKGGPSTLGCIAKRMGMSSRTLQRRLQEKNVSFQDVLDQARRQCVQDILPDKSLALIDVASRLGFTHQAAFNRAFKRWYGETPSRYRHALLYAL